jgi:hypothetical protein
LFPEFGGIIPGGGFSSGLAIDIVSSATAPSCARRPLCIATTLHDDAPDIEWPQPPPPRLSLGGQVKDQDFTQINFFGSAAARCRATGPTIA